jgi:hypothetical protein
MINKAISCNWIRKAHGKGFIAGGFAKEDEDKIPAVKIKITQASVFILTPVSPAL